MSQIMVPYQLFSPYVAHFMSCACIVWIMTLPWRCLHHLPCQLDVVMATGGQKTRYHDLKKAKMELYINGTLQQPCLVLKLTLKQSLHMGRVPFHYIHILFYLLCCIIAQRPVGLFTRLSCLPNMKSQFRHESELPVCRTWGLNMGDQGWRHGC